ncbi:MAG: 2,3,4,5-tetrahydropyridine-2,6-dicarboxylate N-succinyltransferase [Rickettsiaceae bacterium]|nr:2,3,4,5-tetrahydropyridine-2,6-dicarboxylate N-succinyltransferase [Rickettsiaceae bacterium]
MKKYFSQIDEIWGNIDTINKNRNSETFKSAKKIVKIVIDELDKGRERVCSKINGTWIVNELIKKAIFLSFIMHNPEQYDSGISQYFDKIRPKFGEGWDEEAFLREKIRIVPGAYVRKGAYIGKNTVIMPSFINIGAYVDDYTMVDTWSTIGSCAQIGKNCHISGGVGIGGVLEPFQAKPVIIEDNCFIGARSEIAEGVFIEEGSVISMGVYLNASTKIVRRDTGEIIKGRVPAYSVVVPGSLPDKDDISKPALYCAIIIKTVDASTRARTSINELLRY